MSEKERNREDNGVNIEQFDGKNVSMITVEIELSKLNEEIIYLEKQMHSQPERLQIIGTDIEVNIMLNFIQSFNDDLPAPLENKISSLKDKVLSLKQVV